MRFAVVSTLATLVLPFAAAAQSTTPPITLAVDLTDAPHKLVHAVETIPVAPGPLTLVYPKWIPGEHAPSGPIQNQAGFTIEANGQPVKWERDDVDMFSYHVVVPAGATSLTVHTDFLDTAAATGFSAGASSSANLVLLSWNSVLVYPLAAGASLAEQIAATKTDDIMVKPSVTVPAGWHFGSALNGAKPYAAESLPTASFDALPLTQLIDSPVLAGRYFREVPLATDVRPVHYLDLAGDGPEDIAINDEHIAEFTRLVRETGALYKSRHYGSYHFLVTLSDQVAHFGLEHHQSSDDRVEHQTFTDDNVFVADGLLLPHEFTHSWNGKYRRPAGLATANYQQPMKGNLLWVYEGLTEYLGDILAARCGIWTPSVYRDRLAVYLAMYNNERPGRTWRDLQDTATFAQVLYFAGAGYDSWRRNTDYYDEGELMWLEADLTIRTKTHGAKSLNDFAAAFEGLGGNTGPKVVPYTFENVVETLNTIYPMDWAAWLRTRLDANTAGVPELAGLNAMSGYKLTFTDKPNYWSQLFESLQQNASFTYSLGAQISKDGTVADVIYNGPAMQAGLSPGMTIVAVNGRAFTPALLQTAVAEAAGNGPAVQLITANTGVYQVLTLPYHGGLRYPQLERVAGTPALLDDVLQPMTK